MIGFLRGTIKFLEKDHIVLMTAGGVGYKIFLSKVKLSECSLEQEVDFFTYLKVSDSALDLFGFENLEEKKFFELLLSVSGVGPKSAMNILNLGSINDIQAAIAREDVNYLTNVQGLGKKTAERLVVELKAKVSSLPGREASTENSALGEVVEGLIAMGYGKEEARLAVAGLKAEDKNTEDLLRQALKNLSK